MPSKKNEAMTLVPASAIAVELRVAIQGIKIITAHFI
jgi:hypothetical protein